jgi:hypothetical protein
MNLWWHFGRFAAAIEGIDPPAEKFRPVEIEHPRLRVYVLAGQKTWLAWCRDRQNTWQTELAEDRPPQPIREAAIPLNLPAEWVQSAHWRTYDPWTDKWQEVKPAGDRLVLPEFTRSLVIRADRRQ